MLDMVHFLHHKLESGITLIYQYLDTIFKIILVLNFRFKIPWFRFALLLMRD